MIIVAYVAAPVVVDDAVLAVEFLVLGLGQGNYRAMTDLNLALSSTCSIAECVAGVVA